MEKDPDVELMLRFQAGDQNAFRRLFDRHKGRVINYCYRYCGNAQIAEELAQETFLRVYKAASRYQPKARFKTWLYKIAVNVCLNELRKVEHRVPLESLDPTPDDSDGGGGELAIDRNDHPDELVAQSERQHMVLQAIRQLKEDQRAALLLRVDEEFSYTQIGEQIGRSENHVKTLIHRGRKKLKTLLAGYFGETS